MNELCLLAASLLTQNNTSLAPTASLPSEQSPFSHSSSLSIRTSDRGAQSAATIESSAPEFSRCQAKPPSRYASIKRSNERSSERSSLEGADESSLDSDSTGSLPEDEAAAPSTSLDSDSADSSFENETSAHSMSADEVTVDSLSADASIHPWIERSPHATQLGRPSDPAAPKPSMLPRPPSPQRLLPPSPFHSVAPPISIPAALMPESASATSPTPRPASGSQLYQQRWAALRAGQTYTRLPVNSFRSNWINAVQQPTHQQWVDLLAHEARAMAQGQGSNRLTVMVGDSLSLWFPNDRLPRSRFWLNQSISGDTTEGLLGRLHLFNQTRPDTIHVMVGINDLRRGASNQTVLNNLRQIMRQLRHNHPHAQIFVHSILPTRLSAIPSDRIQSINAQLGAIANQESVSYLDLYAYFSDGQGELRPELTTDGLHLNAYGYALWQTALRQFNLA
ncbi:MAG: GDSL-type esterase/lipase family protein [Elainellaceae cyanobacterium]